MTVAHLETERETVLRELLVLKERMEASKESGYVPLWLLNYRGKQLTRDVANHLILTRSNRIS